MNEESVGIKCLAFLNEMNENHEEHQTIFKGTEIVKGKFSSRILKKKSQLQVNFALGLIYTKMLEEN